MDLNPEYDQFFGLNVQKSAVITPIGFQDAIRAAESQCGLVWEDYRKASISTYRQSAVTRLQPTPGRGFLKMLRQVYEEENGSEVTLSISRNLVSPVELDLENRTIKVNSQLRNSALPNASNSSWHAFTTLLFETFSIAFTRDSLSKAMEQKLQTLNRSLKYLSRDCN